MTSEHNVILQVPSRYRITPQNYDALSEKFGQNSFLVRSIF